MLEVSECLSQNDRFSSDAFMAVSASITNEPFGHTYWSRFL